MKGVNSLAGEHLLPCVSWHCPDAPLLRSRFPLGYVFLMGDCGAGADDAPPRVHENVPFLISLIFAFYYLIKKVRIVGVNCSCE